MWKRDQEPVWRTDSRCRTSRIRILTIQVVILPCMNGFMLTLAFYEPNDNRKWRTVDGFQIEYGCLRARCWSSSGDILFSYNRIAFYAPMLKWIIHAIKRVFSLARWMQFFRWIFEWCVKKCFPLFSTTKRMANKVSNGSWKIDEETFIGFEYYLKAVNND